MFASFQLSCCRKLGFCKVRPKNNSIPLSSKEGVGTKFVVDSKDNPAADQGEENDNPKG